MKKYAVAIFEYEEYNPDTIDSNDVYAIAHYLDDWSLGELSLGLPLEVVAYEVCDDFGTVHGIAFVVEDLE